MLQNVSIDTGNPCHRTENPRLSSSGPKLAQDQKWLAGFMNQVIEQISSSTRARLIIAAILLVLAAAGFAAVMLTVYWPFTRQSLIDALQEQSLRSVEIHGFRRTYFPPGCIAEDIRFLHRVHKNKPPLITIRTLIIRGSYLGLLRSPTGIDEARVIGLHVTIPPRGPDGRRPEVMPLTARPSGKSVLISQISADQALLEVQSANPREEAYVVQIHQLVLGHVGDKDQFTFRTFFSISKPPGEIHASGTFGPWDENDPGRTPASGTYTYTNANLGVFEKLAGSLSSKGKFKGTLRHLETDGEADVPNLHIDDASRTIPLTTEFHAIVNATNGDTDLQSVKAHTWRTNATFAGAVTGEEVDKGKTTSLEFSVSRGRIEDLFRMFVRARQPPFFGSVSLRAKAESPPGPEPFLKKLKMQGDFGIANGEFQKADTQARINRLSESSHGESRKEQDDDPETVLSDLSGHVTVQNGVAIFTDMSFHVPGAFAKLHGTFGLISKKVDLHGKLQTTGAPADATSGFKSLLMKVITPFLKKKSAGTVVPFKITGTYEHVSVGLDLGAKN